MQKYLAIILAVIIAIVALLPQSRSWVAEHLAHLPEASSGSVATTSSSGLPLLTPVVFDNILATPVGEEAWAAFVSYRTAAETHDIPALHALSYRLSGACRTALTDSSKATPCYELMDSVSMITGPFKKSDFIRVAYDDKQIILATDYEEVEPGSDPVKAVIYFVRQDTPKILGIRFCVGKEGEGDECVETSPAKRDTNKNGWWDDVEALFR